MSIAQILGSIPWSQVATTGLSLLQQRGLPGMPRPPIPVGQAFTGGPSPFGGAMGIAAQLGGRRQAIGRFSRQAIPPGTKEKISRTGQIILTETHRAKGLTGRDLKGFRRTVRLIRSVGMTPKGLKGRGGFRRKKS
jgi:hypothetical protein